MKSITFYMDEYPTAEELVAEIQLRVSAMNFDGTKTVYQRTSYDISNGRYMMTLSLEKPT